MRSVRFRVVTAAVAIWGLGACSDVNAPTPDATPRGVALPRLEGHQQLSGSLLVITDHVTGHQYTLDAVAGQLTTTELPNEVVSLDVEQLAALRTYFEGTIEADALEAELESAASGWIPPGDVCAPQIADEPPQCVEPMRAVAMTDSERTGLLVVRGPAPRSPKSRIRTADLGGFGRHGSSEIGQSMASMSLGLDPCRDVVNALVPSRLEYRAQRAKPIQTMLGFAIATEGLNGVAGKIFPPGVTSIASVLTIFAEDKANRIRLGVLAWQWNTYQCGGTREISAGPFIRGFGGADPRFKKVCFPEQWTLVWPDGRTKGVTVEVCEYRKM